MRTPLTYEQFTLTSPSAAGGKQQERVGQGKILRWIGLELAGQLTLTAQNNSVANTLRGDEWAALESFELKANGQDTIFTGSGDDLWIWNYLLFDGYPPVSINLGDGTTANPSFKSNLLLPLVLPGSFKPYDTALDTTRFAGLTAEARFGPHTAVNGSASGWTQLPSLKVYSHEGFHTPEPDDDPIFNSRINKLTQNVAGAQNGYQFKLERFPGLYHSFIIRAHVNGVDTPGCISSVKLKRGSDVIMELSESQLIQSSMLYSRRSWPVEKINLGLTRLTDSSTGVADGTVADATAAFSQSITNANNAEFATKINQLIDALNGRARIYNPRISTKSDLRATYHVVLPSDGYLSEGMPTNVGGEPVLEFTTTQACTIDVHTRQLTPIQRRAK